MINIQLPGKIYNAFPWIILLIATWAIVFVTGVTAWLTVLKVGCILALYGYALGIIWMRMRHV